MIAPLTPEQLPLASALGSQFYEEGGLFGRFNREHFEAQWASLIESGAGNILAEIGSGVHGAIGGIAYPDPNSGDLTVDETFWFVQKEYRQSSLALCLLRAFESWAEEIGATQQGIVHLTNSMPDRLARIYRRRGYKPVEVHWRREIV